MLRKAFNILLTLLVLSTTSGFSISKHYCHDQLVDIGLINTQGCGEQDMDDCCKSMEKAHCDKEDVLEDSCCKNESDFIKLDEQFTVQFEKQTKHINAPALISSMVSHLTLSRALTFGSSTYHTPQIIKNIPVLVQSFRC